GNAALRSARHVFCPSAYLRDVALGWGVDPARVSVLPNPAPEVPTLPARDALRAEFEFDGRTLVFAGRLGPQKALGVALEALSEVDAVSVLVAGDGPERPSLERRTAELGLGARCGSSGACRVPGSSDCSAPPTVPCSPRPGRTTPTPSSRRSPSAVR